MLLCDRLHSRFVDFNSSRFVVSTGTGIRIGDKKFERGEEIPQGALSAESLRMEYEPPLRRIELIDYAMKDPNLREACARRGVLLEPKVEEATQPSRPDPGHLTRKELVTFCKQNHLPTHGNDKQLRDRVASFLE